MQQYRGGPRVTVSDGKSQDAKELARVAREQQMALLDMEEERKQQRKNRVSALVQQAPASRDKAPTTTTTTTTVAVRPSQELLNRQFTNQTTLRPGRAVPALHPAYEVRPPSPPSVAIPDDYMEIEVASSVYSEPAPLTSPPPPPPPPSPPPPPVTEEVYDAEWHGPCEFLDVDPVHVMRLANSNWTFVHIPCLPSQKSESGGAGCIRCDGVLPAWARPRRRVAQVIEVVDDGESRVGVVAVGPDGRIAIGPLADRKVFVDGGEIGVPHATTLQYVAADDDDDDSDDAVTFVTEDSVDSDGVFE